MVLNLLAGASARRQALHRCVCAERESGIAEVAMDYIQVEDTVPAHAEREATEADKTVEKTEAAEKEARAGAASKVGTETHKKRVLVGRDRWTKAVLSFLVQCKGIGDSTIVDKVTRWVDALGYRKVVLKTDGGLALVTVQEAVAKARTHETICQNPLRYDPQASGVAERSG